MKSLQNVPRQHAGKILTAGYIKHEMRRVKIVGFWDVKPCSLVGWVSMCQRDYHVHLDVFPSTLNM